MTEVIEGVLVDETGSEIVVRPAAASPTLFNTDDPAEVIARATRTAVPLAAAVRGQNLAVNISGREHVKVEGWTLLGSMLGVFPICVWTRKLEDGWEARVEARTRDGALIGAAEAECLRSESLWSSRDDYALRSMAQTRATSKALRQPLGFVMQLAGFDATPAEEMPHGNGGGGQASSSNGGGEAPASDKQRSYLGQLAGKAGVAYEVPADLSKQEASRLIEALKAGDTSVLGAGLDVCGECGGVNGQHDDSCSESIPF